LGKLDRLAYKVRLDRKALKAQPAPLEFKGLKAPQAQSAIPAPLVLLAPLELGQQAHKGQQALKARPD
jgi:hypothetical protein